MAAKKETIQLPAFEGDPKLTTQATELRREILESLASKPAEWWAVPSEVSAAKAYALLKKAQDARSEAERAEELRQTWLWLDNFQSKLVDIFRPGPLSFKTWTSDSGEVRLYVNRGRDKNLITYYKTGSTKVRPGTLTLLPCYEPKRELIEGLVEHVFERWQSWSHDFVVPERKENLPASPCSNDS